MCGGEARGKQTAGLLRKPGFPSLKNRLLGRNGTEGMDCVSAPFACVTASSIRQVAIHETTPIRDSPRQEARRFRKIGLFPPRSVRAREGRAALYVVCGFYMNPATVPFAASRKLPGKMPSSRVATTSTTSAKKSEGALERLITSWLSPLFSMNITIMMRP